MDFDTAKFIDSFIDVGRERLLTLEKSVMSVSGPKPSSDLVEELMREAHTLKGEARMIGLDEISHLAHELEDMFLAWGQGELAGTENTDATTSLLEKIQDIRLKLDLLAKKDSSDSSGTKSHKDSNTPETMRIRAERIQKITDLAIETVCSYKQIERTNQFFRSICKGLPDLHTLWDDLFPYIKKCMSDEDVHLNRLGEFTQRFYQLCDHLQQMRSRCEMAMSMVSPVTNALLVECLAARMRPLSVILDAYPGEVQRLASALNRKVNLHIEGKDIELDRAIVHAINEPLIHMVRNAVDHGIEDSFTRESKGKDAVGNLWIRAKRQGQKVIIEVEDDGKGLDFESIRNKSLERGIILEDKITSDDGRICGQVKEIIFTPGFSTKEEVTEVSGRGVGMDTIKQAIDHLNGMLEIYTWKDKGTKVVIELPLSLALMPVLMVDIGGRFFSIPTHWIEDIVFLDKSQILHHEGVPRIVVDGKAYYLYELSSLLGGYAKEDNTFNFHSRRPVVILSNGHLKGAYVVDDLIDQIETVLKSVPSYINTEIIVGANIFEDGKISLLINVPSILRKCQGDDIPSPKTFSKVTKKIDSVKILAVDDAVITRSLLKNILLSAGYDVKTATNGMEALDILSRSSFDLVVTDLEMPIMDGLELTRRIKANPRLKDIPVVILSSHEEPEDIRTGIDAGADAYLPKGGFKQKKLIETLEHLLNRKS